MKKINANSHLNKNICRQAINLNKNFINLLNQEITKIRDDVENNEISDPMESIRALGFNLLAIFLNFLVYIKILIIAYQQWRSQKKNQWVQRCFRAVSNWGLWVQSRSFWSTALWFINVLPYKSQILLVFVVSIESTPLHVGLPLPINSFGIHVTLKRKCYHRRKDKCQTLRKHL